MGCEENIADALYGGIAVSVDRLKKQRENSNHQYDCV
ncbi:hypothetical protein BOA8489_03975 [Boseongicola aestuarii]|uniref:Uncharacterized protein n=1 Tax=Boseongicola aestuarii TaxID=1470561 RepID=A0A238J7A4_9RHOB|nr:hypothetical protein BOA8489_03975 [Boseongicola aestuarii]